MYLEVHAQSRRQFGITISVVMRVVQLLVHELSFVLASTNLAGFTNKTNRLEMVKQEVGRTIRIRSS